MEIAEIEKKVEALSDSELEELYGTLRDLPEWVRGELSHGFLRVNACVIEELRDRENTRKSEN